MVDFADSNHKQRTITQNRSLHLFFELLADELNRAGLDQRKVLKETIDIPWTPESIKEQLWRPIQKAQLGKTSTTELEKSEIDKVYNTLIRHLGEKFGISVDFPSQDTMNLLETMKKQDLI